MLTIYYSNGSTQVLRNFHESIHLMTNYQRLKLLKELVNDIAKGDACTFHWDELT